MFDWNVLAKLDLKLPYLVSGGLTADNLAEAVRVTRAGGVDVSSGVESAPGVKDPEMIRNFRAAAPPTLPYLSPRAGRGRIALAIRVRGSRRSQLSTNLPREPLPTLSPQGGARRRGRATERHEELMVR